MSGSSSVPPPTFGPAGFVAPLESAILAGRTADINTAFGGALAPSPATPQGQLASSDAKIIGDANDQFLAMANGVDPSYAQGRFQDAIGRIYFIERMAATSTLCQGCLCVGLPGTVLPAGGATAQDGSGNLYSPTATGTISGSGTVTLDFACLTTGAIACPANTLSVYQLIPGWNTINNPTDGIVGSPVEGRAAFEARRSASVAQNSLGFNGAILGAVLSVPGVTDAVVRDNSTSSAVTSGGVTIAANSLYVCVAGSASQQSIANAIWTKKPPGCAYSGSTTLTVLDTNAAYTPPYPSYSVAFTPAAGTPIYVAVSIANTAGVPANALVLVRTAVIAAFNGTDGGPSAHIGSEIFAFRFAGGIAALGTWAQIISIFVGTSASPTTTTTAVNLNQVPTIAAGNITLTLV